MNAQPTCAESWESRIGVPESFTGQDRDPKELPGGTGWGPLMKAMRSMLDAVAAARPDQSTLEEMTRDVAAMGERFERHRVEERNQAFGHRVDLPGRGQVMAPCFVAGAASAGVVEGTVTFGHYFLGGNGAVHGGAVALLFDEVLGRLSDTSGRPQRGRPASRSTSGIGPRPVSH